MFWGCPALRAGRAVPGSQVCSAHRFFALLKSSVWPSATLSIPQPVATLLCGGCAACYGPKEKPQPNTKKGPFPHLMTNFGPRC
ncbi:hypothetical protein SGRA_2916 [Saprospira grandis str. Lewin]|uniref:Uncharacterized protein n=1 Tax=Saprospira grandis (strain Lewin) TaxID=984262 RepID=H6LAQ1_SAPGL|nr:hypothetical protein SGRA_2916 [Saprospira grandis str. Lewin]